MGNAVGDQPKIEVKKNYNFQNMLGFVSIVAKEPIIIYHEKSKIKGCDLTDFAEAERRYMKKAKIDGGKNPMYRYWDAHNYKYGVLGETWDTPDRRTSILAIGEKVHLVPLFGCTIDAVTVYTNRGIIEKTFEEISEEDRKIKAKEDKFFEFE